jgi:uncharacterized membrane protein YhaH (DUF805 family)
VRSGEIFLSFEGRLDRERWLGAAGLFVATVVATYLATWLLWRGGALSFSAREAIRTFVQIALLVPWFALDWKRFHDIEHSGRWAMICPSLIILSRTWDWPAVAARAGTAHEPIGLALSWLHGVARLRLGLPAGGTRPERLRPRAAAIVSRGSWR